MSLLSVTVKKARYVGIQATQFNTYVTLKLQNVKSTTVTVKGPTPSWEQDFLLKKLNTEGEPSEGEINDINLGLLVEVWNKGVIWDRALGYHYLPLTSVAYDEQECGGRWVELEAQLMMRGGAVVGTTGPTGHALLLDCRFEPPFDAEGTGGADLQRKLDLLNGALDAERQEQARRQLQYVAHSGYSEDSDYTSDLNYPVGQHANCSASQFRNAAHQMHTPQRSLEVSRENSYERDEYHLHGDTDPLYYNSQPRTNRIDTWSQLHAQASVESAISWRTAADWQSGEEQRRPSLERQNTLYDDSIGYGYDPYTPSTHIRDHSHNLSHQASYEEYYDSSSYPYPYDPQWDGRYYYEECGLTTIEYENVVNKRRSSVVQLPQMPPKQLPPSSRYSDYNEMAPYRPRPRRTAASLPATPSSTPKRGRALPVAPGSESGWSRRVRRLPQPPAVSTKRLPQASSASIAPPTTTRTHVPYIQEPERRAPNASYRVKTRDQNQDTTVSTSLYQDTNYNSTGYDDEGMQPFFDETPHATPPAAQTDHWPKMPIPDASGKRIPWASDESDTATYFSYPGTVSDDTVIHRPVSSKITSHIQPTVTTKQDITTTQNERNYQQYDLNKFDDKQQYQKFDQQEQSYQDSQNQYLDQKPDRQLQYQYETQYEDEKGYPNSEQEKYNIQYDQHEYQQQQNIHTEHHDQKYFDNQQQENQYQHHDSYQQQHQDYTQQDYQLQQDMQYEKQQQELHHKEQHQDYLRQQQDQQLQQQKQQQAAQQQQLQYQQQQQQQQQQQKLPAQQLQSSVLTGAATLGSFMAGGAKKLGSFFGAAAAAVAPSVTPQQQQKQQQQLPSVSMSTPVTHIDSTLTSIYDSASVTPFTSATAISTTTSVPISDVSSSVPITSVTTSAPSLPRTPSLKRQESMQRPSVRRTRTLPDAPEDYPTGSFDESAYEDEYNKTELDQVDRDRTSLDRYRDEEYVHDTIHEDVVEEEKAAEQRSPSIQKTASPTKVVSQARKPSVDSYHSQAPSILDRKTSQSSFISQHDEKLTIPTTLEESLTDKSKVSFHEERTTYHEVPDEQDRFERQESFDQDAEYPDDQDQDETFRDDQKFQDQERFDEADEQYPEDSVFNEDQDRQDEEQMDFQPEQPKLTPKQRWHRAYNKIVMQLNVSTFYLSMIETD